MKDKSISILSTRPLDEALIAQAAQHNIAIDQETFIEIKKSISVTTFEQIKQLQSKNVSVVFTSMNAVEILIESLNDKSNIPNWNIYCMSGTTLTLVEQYWTNESVSGTGKNATELAQIIIADKQTEVYFFCGNKRREELPSILYQQGITVNELMVYETIEIATKVEKEHDAILFFSPSAVHSFFQKNTVGNDTIIFAIGDTTAATIKTFCSNRIVLSDFPSKEKMVEQAIKMMEELRVMSSISYVAKCEQRETK